MNVSAEEKKYRIEDDLRTVRRAEEIRADKGRLSAVRRLIMQEQRALGKIAKMK